MEKSAEKRPAPGEENLLHGIRAILTEVEGTTTPLSFVKEKLYGYLKNHTTEYLTSHFADKELQELVENLRKQAAKDVEAQVEDAIALPPADAPEQEVINAVVDNITRHVSKGQMTEAVRKIIACIWRDGYKKKAIVGELFDDVYPALKKLNEQGTHVYVFSSKCSDSQRLLFGHTKEGDLSEKIAGFYDSTAGPKTEKDSYAKIAQELELSPGEVLYLTHQSTEATAAHAAGLKTYLVLRPGNPQPSTKDLETFSTISSFADLFGDNGPEIPHKKKACHEHSSPQKHDSEVVKEAK